FLYLKSSKQYLLYPPWLAGLPQIASIHTICMNRPGEKFVEIAGRGCSNIFQVVAGSKLFG
ncbi:MAG: hypothetical protein K2X81_02890, partial [Candidatus Obscuribacterales bacterium]|nr:hypothetical protein [Candidatus Obscuribacterales bacterium]